MAYKLNLFLGSQHIGTLNQDAKTGVLKIRYTQPWRKQGYAISPALSLSNRHKPASTFNFLDNLLPEGEARGLLALQLGVSEKHLYPQIRALGSDLAGAIRICEQLPENEPPQFRPITEQELATRLSQKEDLGLLNWDEQPRLSVAGVQDKINVFMQANGEIGFGDGAYCSTHILKFEKPSCPNLVINELVCMRLSAAAGLPTAKVLFKRFGEHPALLVERFDRLFNATKNKVMRRHVLDGCQLLDLPREYKYERNLGDGRDVKHIRDGVSLPKLFAFSRRTSSPIQSMQWLINWQLFNLMISNYDSHGKNVSCFYGRDQSEFTPAYDLVNVAMFSQFKHILAMGMGDEFEPDSIHAYQLADFAESCEIDKKLLSRMLVILANKVLGVIDCGKLLASLSEENQLHAAEQTYCAELLGSIRQRTTHLLAQAGEIPSITV